MSVYEYEEDNSNSQDSDEIQSPTSKNELRANYTDQMCNDSLLGTIITAYDKMIMYLKTHDLTDDFLVTADAFDKFVDLFEFKK